MIDELGGRCVGREADAIVGRSVEPVLKRVEERTVYGDVGGGAVVGVDVGVDSGGDDAGGENLKREGVAIDERQLLDGALLDDQTDGGTGGLKLLDTGADLDDLRGGAELESNVLLIDLVDIDYGVDSFNTLEAAALNRDGV